MSPAPPSHLLAAESPGAATSAGADAAAWRLRLLGGFALDDGQQRLTRLRSRAAMALLARLAMAAGRDHAREELAALLWPEADAEAGLRRLRQTLSLLKAVLEPPGTAAVLLADRRVLRVAPGGLWCDVPAFEAACRQRDAVTAQSLYRGDLLPGLYDEWIEDERRRLASLAERLGDAQPLPAAQAQVPLTSVVPGAAPAPGHSAAASVPPSAAPPPVLASPGTATARAAVPYVADTAQAADAATAAVTRSPTHRPAASRLPSYLTRLIGAELSGARLRALVAAQRLVTVLGPGGAGKTRLAVEVATWLSQPGPDQGHGAQPAAFERALMVPLVGATTADQVLDRLLLALRLGAGGDAVDLLSQALDGQSLLLVMDNCEQLDDSAVMALATLTERLPAAHWLLTSRRPMGLDGEHEFALDALVLPALDDPTAELALNPAVALFVDRARAHRPDFHVHTGNAQALAALVQWLDGLPLAIELAAAQVRTQGPAALLALLQAARADAARQGAAAGSLAYLARRGPRSGTDPRLASMLAVVDWSWRLLSPPARTLLARLALLPAGALPQAACWLAADQTPPLPLPPTQALLDQLVSHSVLKAQPGQDGQLRYAPPEAVREHALTQLRGEVTATDAADGRPAGQRRLLDWLQHWAINLPATPPLATVRDELPNVMAAVAAAAEPGAPLADANAALRLVVMLQTAWGEIALPAGVLDSIERLLRASGLDDAHAAAAHALAATAYQVVGQPDDVRRHAAAALARPCPDPGLRATVLSRVARMRWRIDKDADGARALIDEALPLARLGDKPNTEAALLSLLAHLASVVDRDPARARALSGQSLALWTQSGNRLLIAAGRYNSAVQAVQAGRAAEVLGEFDQLAADGRELQDWDLLAGALEAKGHALQKLRRWAESAEALRDSVAIAWDSLEMLALAHALWNLPPALLRLGQAQLAGQTMGAAEVLWRQRFGAFDANDRRDLKRVRRGARLLLGQSAAQAAWGSGAAQPLRDLVQTIRGCSFDAE